MKLESTGKIRLYIWEVLKPWLDMRLDTLYALLGIQLSSFKKTIYVLQMLSYFYIVI